MGSNATSEWISRLPPPVRRATASSVFLRNSEEMTPGEGAGERGWVSEGADSTQRHAQLTDRVIGAGIIVAARSAVDLVSLAVENGVDVQAGLSRGARQSREAGSELLELLWGEVLVAEGNEAAARDCGQRSGSRSAKKWAKEARTLTH